MAKRNIVDMFICQADNSVNNAVIIALANDGTSYWMQPSNFGTDGKNYWKSMPLLPDSEEIVVKELHVVPDPFAK